MLYRKPLPQLENLLKKGGVVVLNGNQDDHKAFYKKAIAYALQNQYPAGPIIVKDLTDLQNQQTPGLFDDGAKGDPFYIIESLKDKDLAAAIEYQTQNLPQGVLVFEAGWTTKSKSYGLCEAAKNVLLFPCYGLELNDFLSYIKALLQNINLSLTPQAALTLATLLQDQPSLLFPELDKLALYALDQPNPIGDQEVQELCAAKVNLQLDEILVAFLLKDKNALVRHGKPDLLEEHGLMLFRLLARQVIQLMELQSLRARGEDISNCWMRTYHPIFYKMQPHFANALKKWRPEEMIQALARLTDLEVLFKSGQLDGSQIQQALA